MADVEEFPALEPWLDETGAEEELVVSADELEEFTLEVRLRRVATAGNGRGCWIAQVSARH